MRVFPEEQLHRFSLCSAQRSVSATPTSSSAQFSTWIFLSAALATAGRRQEELEKLSLGKKEKGRQKQNSWEETCGRSATFSSVCADLQDELLEL